uniref:Uncharacterized protein n=1 Tax=Meloidogyne enterolobii TaxID=390850 RepID=A0A6V7WFI3_MELEN|nr:unnamed protein product [Meloidogyne enterolobii]
MKKITILFSIFLIINFSSTIKAANSQQDLPGGLLGGLLGVLGNVIDFLRNLLTPKFNLNDEELKDLAEKLGELAKLGYTITQEELQKRVQQVFEINKLTGGEWTAKLNLVSLLPPEAQKKLCGTLGVEANGNTNDEPPRDKRGALRAKRADSCSYKIDFDVRNKWPRCRSIISRAVSKFRFSISIFDFRGFFPFDFRFPIFEILRYFRFSISEFLKKFEFLAPKSRNSDLSAIINLKNFRLRRKKRKKFGLRIFQNLQNFRLRRRKGRFFS